LGIYTKKPPYEAVYKSNSGQKFIH